MRSKTPLSARRFEQAFAQDAGNVVVDAEHALLGVARVAAEEFVAAVAGEQFVDAVLLRAQGAVVGGHGGRIAEGLVVAGGHLRACRATRSSGVT